MSNNLELQGPLMRSAIAGGAAVGIYVFYSYLSKSFEVTSSEPMSKN